MSLLESGISRGFGVGEEFIRPSERAIAIASANFDWVIASFLFDLTPRTPNSGPDEKVPKIATKEEARLCRTGPSRSRGEAGRVRRDRRLSSRNCASPHIPATP